MWLRTYDAGALFRNYTSDSGPHLYLNGPQLVIASTDEEKLALASWSHELRNRPMQVRHQALARQPCERIKIEPSPKKPGVRVRNKEAMEYLWFGSQPCSRTAQRWFMNTVDQNGNLMTSTLVVERQSIEFMPRF